MSSNNETTSSATSPATTATQVRYLDAVPSASSYLEASRARKIAAQEELKTKQSEVLTKELQKLNAENPRVEINLESPLDNDLSSELLGKGYNVFTQIVHRSNNGETQNTCRVVVELPTLEEEDHLQQMRLRTLGIPTSYAPSIRYYSIPRWSLF